MGKLMAKKMRTIEIFLRYLHPPKKMDTSDNQTNGGCALYLKCMQNSIFWKLYA
jgi:hypothetical protein